MRILFQWQSALVAHPRGSGALLRVVSVAGWRLRNKLEGVFRAVSATWLAQLPSVKALLLTLMSMGARQKGQQVRRSCRELARVRMRFGWGRREA